MSRPPPRGNTEQTILISYAPRKKRDLQTVIGIMGKRQRFPAGHRTYFLGVARFRDIFVNEAPVM